MKPLLYTRDVYTCSYIRPQLKYGNEGDQNMERKDAGSPNSRSRKGSSTVSTPESFTYETRFVVLNFMSFNPHRSPPFQIYTPSSTSESENLLSSRYGRNSSLPGTPNCQSHSVSNRTIRKLRKGNTIDLGIAANRHSKLPHPRSDTTQDFVDTRQRRYTLHHHDTRLHEVKEEDGFHSISSGKDKSERQLVDSPLKETYVKQTYSTHEAMYRSATDLQNHETSSQKINEIGGSSHQLMDEENVQDVNALFKYSIERSESSSARDCHTELSYHSDADDEYEESHSSTMLRSLNAHHTSQNELNLNLPLQKDSFLKPDVEDDTPKTGVFSPNLDIADTAFVFEADNRDKNMTLNHTNGVIEKESNLQKVTSSIIEGNDVTCTVQTHISVATSDDRVEESETEITCIGEVLPPFSSESEDCLTSSVSLEEQSDEMAPATSSSHDVEGVCCSTHARPLDRSKLRLEIKDHYRDEFQCLESEVDAVVESMKAELEEEMSCLESEVANAIKHKRISPVYSPFLIPLTPQSEAAKILARIGDEVKEKYESKLETAMKDLFCTENATITYHRFKDVAKDVVDENLPGWRQVALLLVYGQRAAWRAVETGHHGIGDLVDNTARLLAESAAGFIIQQGGWGAVMNYDLSQSSSESPSYTPESLKDIMSPWRSDLHLDTSHSGSIRKSQSTESKFTENFTYQHVSTTLDQSTDLYYVHSTNTHQSCSPLAHRIDILNQSNTLNFSDNNNHKCHEELINPVYQYFEDDIEQSPENLPVLPPGWSVDNADDNEVSGVWKDITEFYFTVVMVCSISMFLAYTSKH